jgi:hypothetical protein
MKCAEDMLAGSLGAGRGETEILAAGDRSGGWLHDHMIQSLEDQHGEDIR